MAVYRRRFRRKPLPALPVVLDETGNENVLANIEERLELVDSKKKDYVYIEFEKSSGKLVKFLISAEAFKRLSKADINRLYKGMV